MQIKSLNFGVQSFSFRRFLESLAVGKGSRAISP